MNNNNSHSVTVKFFQKEIIDFNSDLSFLGDRQLKLVNKPSRLYIPDKKMTFLKITKKPKGMLHYEIEISDLGNLKLKEGEELLKCSICGNSTYSARGDFEADGKRNEFPIQFCLCPSSIKDYGETLDKDAECTVTFSITITGEKCFKPHIEYGEVKLEIPRIRSRIFFDYKAMTSEMIYSIKQEPCRIGTLVIKHCSNLHCAPSISHATFALQTLIKKGDNQDVEVFVEYPSLVYGLKAGNPHVSCTVNTRSELHVNYLESGNKFEVPVFWYMNDVMANPNELENVFKLQLKNIQGNIALDDSLFILKRNHCITRLDTKLNTQTHIWDILENKLASEPCPMKINVGAKLYHTLVFRNTADAHPGEDIHSCVKVWGVKISVNVNEAISKRLKLQEGKTIKDVVSLHHKESQALITEGEYVDLGPQDKLDIVIRFDSQYIKWIDPAPNESETWIPIRVSLSYNFIEDSNGRTYRHEPETLDKENKLKALKRTFTYEVHLTIVSTSPWLCVDFGTSAIVAASASFHMGELNLSLINLRQRKSTLLNEAFPDKSSNIDEEGVLINSILCLNPTPDLKHAFDLVTGTDSDFKKYTFLLSPGDDVLNADYMAPSLKLLMGYDKIPNIFSVIQRTYKYAVQDGVDDDGSPIIKPHSIIENGCSTELMSLEKIVKIVYLQLFKHYLRTAAYNAQQRIERLVMTVPNTYTPLQLDFIRRIAREALPELRPEEFHLVSESDAVACYYLYKREVLLQQMKIDNPSIYNNAERRVLIYDMGAGTLDLTLMCTTQEHDSLNVRMLGKLGVSKAGNYLDYVIGQILVEAVRDNVTSIQILGSDEATRKLGADHLNNLLTPDINDRLGSSKERLALKTYIKEMKKQLNCGEETHLINLPEDNEIAKWAGNAGVTYNFNALKVKDVRNHVLFTKYIRSVTTDLLKDFEMYVCQTNPEFKIQEIDVVVFSGRSTQLMDIRRNVKESLKENSHIYYVDLINERSSTEIDEIMGQGEQSTKLKTVVAEGAYHSVNFMNKSKTIALDPRKIFASFGFVQYDRTRKGLRIWTPLIQAQIPCRGEGIEVDECQSYIKVTREIDVNGNRYIDLIQSYCGDVAGCENYSSNETINVLASIELPMDTEKAKVEFTLYVEPVNGTEKSIHLKINDQEYDVNPHVDIQRNIALRRSLWPVVFS
jgi:hypothetical protein